MLHDAIAPTVVVMSAPIPDLAIVVVTHNSESVIGDLLDSLPAALGGLTADVVVVDNASQDSTVAVVEARGDCRVLVGVNAGYSAGINTGIAACPAAPAVLVLNPDVRMHKGSVSPLLVSLRDGIGIACPRIHSEDGVLQFSLRREPTLLRALGLSRARSATFSEYIQEPTAYTNAGLVDWALGAVLAISRDCLVDVGRWDESFFLYSEETDYCLRAREHGYGTWFVPESVAVHVGGASGRNDLTHTLQIVNRVRLYARRHGLVAGAAYHALTVLSEVSWLVRGHAQSRAAIRALLRPNERPVQLGCTGGLVPR